MYHICSKEAERAKLPALFFIQFGGPIQLATFRVGVFPPLLSLSRVTVSDTPRGVVL